MNASNHNHDLQIAMQVIQPWLAFSSLIHRPTTEKEYDKLVQLLDKLQDLPLSWKNEQLDDLIHYISDIIEKYDEKHYAPKLKTTGINTLKFLMEQYGLKQSDLSEIGSQSVISEILNGKRPLNLKHIKALAKRFGVNPEVFIDD